MLSRIKNSIKAFSGNPEIQSSIRRRTLNMKGKIRRWIGWSECKEDVEMYDRMKKDHELSGSLYMAGEFWKNHNRRHADAIWGGGLLNLRNEYFNRTFSGPLPESRQVYRALLFMYYKHVKRMDIDGFLERFEDPSEGLRSCRSDLVLASSAEWG